MQADYLSLLPMREVTLIWGLNELVIVKYLASSIHVTVGFHLAFSPLIYIIYFLLKFFTLWNWSLLHISTTMSFKIMHVFLFLKVFYWLYWRKVWALDLNFICCGFLWKIHCNWDWCWIIIKWLSCYFLLLHKKEVGKKWKHEVTCSLDECLLSPYNVLSTDMCNFLVKNGYRSSNFLHICFGAFSYKHRQAVKIHLPLH